MSVRPAPTTARRCLGESTDLVRQWVRVHDDGSAGLLPAADHTGWTLRTPTGNRTGRGPLAAEPISRRTEARTVRRRLRAVMDDPSSPGTAALDLLDLQVAAHP